ncbi:MAG: glycosyltransferase [Nanoarchaeota archaeon]|nr:glycosyltransferase [Nanoarchaeota archaeon]
MTKKIKVDVIIPVYNEQRILESSIDTLRTFLKKNFRAYEWKIIIANNASRDNTLEIAKQITKKYNNIELVHLDQKGRGRALKKAWLSSKADIMSYMDVDLSTELSAFPEMIKGMLTKRCNVATGTRLTKKSNTVRCLFREVLSRGYNKIVRIVLWIHYSDAQCGFKAVTKKTVKEIVPLIKDNEWFFDTELLTLAEKYKYGIYELPIKWVEDKDSRVSIIKTVYQYLRDVARLRLDLWFRKDLRILKTKTR